MMRLKASTPKYNMSHYNTADISSCVIISDV